MKQPNPEAPSPTKPSFALSSIFQFIVFIVAIILLQIPMLYVVGSETYYTDDQHPLDHVFSQQKYQKVITSLSNPKKRYINIEGTRDSGVVSFMKHYAAMVKNKKPVIIREYSDDQFQAIYSAFRFAKSLVEEKIDLEEDTPKLWILFCFNSAIPKTDITHLQASSPEDRIILVTSNKQKIKNFSSIKFPVITIQMLQKTLQERMNMDEKTVSILTTHYGSVPAIFDNLNQKQFDLQQFIGPQYAPISPLDESSKLILQELCQKGTVEGQIDNLLPVGVILEDGIYYWREEKSMLNYALQERQLCSGGIASEEVLAQYDNINDYDDNPEVNQNNREQGTTSNQESEGKGGQEQKSGEKDEQQKDENNNDSQDRDEKQQKKVKKTKKEKKQKKNEGDDEKKKAKEIKKQSKKSKKDKAKKQEAQSNEDTNSGVKQVQEEQVQSNQQKKPKNKKTKAKAQQIKENTKPQKKAEGKKKKKQKKQKKQEANQKDEDNQEANQQ